MPHTPSTLPLTGIRAPLIGRLPVEVLSQVLRSAAPPQQDVEAYEPRRFPGWIVFAGVCRYWRDVIHGNPKFWRCIDVGHNLEWLRLCLQRSAQLNVRILLRESLDVHSAEVLELIAPHKDRIATFMDLGTLTCDKPQYSLFPMQELRYLAVGMKHVNHPEDQSKHPAACPIVSLVPAVGEHGGTFPNLQSVVCSDISVGIPAGLTFSSLICLGLRDCSNRDPITDPSCHILHVLSACPSLQQFIASDSLASIMPPKMDIPDIVPRIVALPKLRVLQLLEPAELISKFISRLQLPDNIDLTLSTYVDTEPDMAPALLDMLPSAQEDRDRLAILRAVTDVTVNVDLWPGAEITITALVDIHHPCRGRVVLSVQNTEHDGDEDEDEDEDEELWDYEVPPTWAVLTDLPFIFPAGTPIKSLACCGKLSELPGVGPWEEPLEPYQASLHTLVLVGVGSSPDVLSLCHALGECEGAAGALCPNLKTVEIYSVTLSPELMAAVHACVERRRDGGCPLTEFSLYVCEHEHEHEHTEDGSSEMPPEKEMTTDVSTAPKREDVEAFREEMKRILPGFELQGVSDKGPLACVEL
ncbi:hypothetical protein C8Q74DRAFT_1363401 [Fomes fomentarius]|nr:hypothetical protein C8Q74DRAFT_1363401 [Fomes fomentarius]